MYPHTLRFLRAVRTHLTAARYVLLAALNQVDPRVGRLAIAATSAVVKRRNERDPCVKHCIRRTQSPTPVLARDTPLSLAAGGDSLRLPIFAA
ncbi:hypothetical protein XCCB100_3506 [Xanthomonas campestris pv. campestris]|uniref:Uncharacterized protein n=1 Tax=Xanthomonas campestris pv. campestris (strain B100) TaxID=509169 RepID=B0RUC9_XANCB|nr:hypothetical protein XCCB100_3506 [Xanthomonas campestris pv. campestris]